jgi:hypothetical protein
MKKYLPKIFSILLLSSVVFAISFLPLHAHAQELSPTGLVASVIGFIVSIVLLPLLSLLVYMGGIILNYAVEFSVVNMASNLTAGAVGEAWRTIRDVANMGFIFVLLYSSIMTIFGQSKLKETIVKIIIAALLINFSLFFTSVIIDTSNLLALTFYHAIAPGALDPNHSIHAAGISNAFMAQLGVQNVFHAVGFLGGGKLIVAGIVGSIALLVVAYVFFVVAIMFVIRFVVLAFVLILSPIMFLADIFPGLGSFNKQWWGALWGQAFFAPVYFLLTWIVLKVSQGLFSTSKDFMGAISAAAGGGVPDPSTAGVLLNYVVFIAFLIASLLIAKSIANKAGGGVQKLTGFATGMVMGGVAGLGRKSLGAAGTRFADSEALRNAVKSGGLTGFAARRALDLSSAASKSSFDIRAAGGPAKGLVGIAGGGKAGGQGGHAKEVTDEAKKNEEKIKLYTQPSDITKDKAKRELEAAKALNSKDPRDPAFVAEWKAEREKQAQAQKDAEQELIKAEERVADVDVIDNLQNKLDETKKNRSQTNTVEGFKKYRLDQAQNRVDELEGVDEKEQTRRKKALDAEAKKTIENDPATKKRDALKKEMDDLAKEIEKQTGAIKETMEKELEAKKELFETVAKEAEERSKTIKAEFEERKELIRQEKSLGDKRKEAAIESMLNPGLISTDRAFFVGSVRRSNLQASANLRKGKKTARELIDEALKVTGEKSEGEPAGKKDGEKEEGEEKPEGEGEKK